MDYADNDEDEDEEKEDEEKGAMLWGALQEGMEDVQNLDLSAATLQPELERLCPSDIRPRARIYSPADLAHPTVNTRFALPPGNWGSVLQNILNIMNANQGSKVCKIGSCFHNQVHLRPFSREHYHPKYFRDDQVYIIAYGIECHEVYALLERHAIAHAKYILKVGVNVRVNEKKVPKKNRPTSSKQGCIYMVLGKDYITSQLDFENVHVSTYMRDKLGMPPEPSKTRTIRSNKGKIKGVGKPHKPHKTRIDKGMTRGPNKRTAKN